MKNNDYSFVNEVLVLGTMSSGKTTLLNALLGKEILPSANTATTASITSIWLTPKRNTFMASCYSKSGVEIDVSAAPTPEIIRGWNANSEVIRIHLKISQTNQRRGASGFILHDSPGPNNSQDEQHALLLKGALQDLPYKTLCYVLNASQIGITDDRKLLDELKNTLAKKNSNIPIYFILNKVDLLDAEKGETLSKFVHSVRGYLVNAGFKAPVVIATMAQTALLARKELASESLTRSQRVALNIAVDEIGDDLQNLDFSSWQVGFLSVLAFLGGKAFRDRIIRKRKLKKLEYISGIKAIEKLIKSQPQLGAAV